MAKKTEKKKSDPNPSLDAALLEMAQDGLLSPGLSEKITMRLLGSKGPPKLQPLTPDEIRALRQHANMSQAVFARLLNVTTGYVSQIERGAKRPTGPALAMLSVIKRKGIQAIL
jgi:putative transcriptional regulator